MEVKYDSWDKITINKYKEIYEIANRDCTEAEKNVAVIASLCDVDENDIWNLTLPELSKLQDKLQWVHKPAFNKEGKFSSIRIGKYDCVCDPSLKTMTMAQYVDFQNYWSQKQTTDNMAYVVACFVIPKGYTYNEGYDMAEFINEINSNLSYKTAVEICFFIQGALQSSTKDTLISLKSQLKKIAKKKEMKNQKEKMNQAMSHLEHLISTIG